MTIADQFAAFRELQQQRDDLRTAVRALEFAETVRESQLQQAQDRAARLTTTLNALVAVLRKNVSPGAFDALKHLIEASQ